MRGFQFNGKDEILQAYENRGVPSFAIWAGRQMIFPFATQDLNQGAKALGDFLDDISNGSNIIYTLKVYEDLEANGKIKEKTASDGSFNFKLDSDEMQERQQSYLAGANVRNNALVSRLAAIEAKLDQGGNAELTTLDHIKEFCDTEAGKIAVPQIVGAILSALLPQRPQISGLPAVVPQRARMSGVEEDSDARIDNAISVLQQHDPKLPEHLEKLANIAATNPASFQSLLAILDNL